MTRRVLLLAAAAARLRGDAADEVWRLMASAASSLSESDGAGFLGQFDRRMPEYDRLSLNVAALLRVATLQSAIDLVTNEGDEHARTVAADWLLHITERRGPPDIGSTITQGKVIRREQRVKCGVERQGRRWRIVSFEPVGLFDPVTF